MCSWSVREDTKDVCSEWYPGSLSSMSKCPSQGSIENNQSGLTIVWVWRPLYILVTHSCGLRRPRIGAQVKRVRKLRRNARLSKSIRRTLRIRTIPHRSLETKFHARAGNGQSKRKKSGEFNNWLTFTNELSVRIRDMHGGARLRDSLTVRIGLARKAILGHSADFQLHASQDEYALRCLPRAAVAVECGSLDTQHAVS